MAKLRVTFPVNLTPEEEALRVQVYWERLGTYSISHIESAADRALGAFKWFPKPSELQVLIMDQLNEDWLDGRRDNIPQIGHSETVMDKKKAIELLQSIQKKLKVEDPAKLPTLTGTAAETFEQKRNRAVKIAKKYLS